VDKDLLHWNDDQEVWLEKGTQIVGVEVPSTIKNSTSGSDESSHDTILSIDEKLHLYRDSVAVLPSKLSPADAISTAATSLLGVHCGGSSHLLPSSSGKHTEKKGKIVIVGGGDYASFLARALVGLGNEVSLVSARPGWSLPSESDIIAPSSSKRKEEGSIEILPPAVGPMSLGFATAIDKFDTLIDTLGDEMGMGRALTLVDNEMLVGGGRLLEQLKEVHGCTNYISTLTRSQQYVLNKGLIFARDPVVRYQKEVEKSSTSGKYQVLSPPSNFGATLQLLLDRNIVYPSDQNENGPHDAKSNFVRGWSLSDLTELKTWPREGPGRFGFPVVDLSAPPVSLRRKATAATVSARNSPKEGEEDGSIGDISAKDGVENSSSIQSSVSNKSSNNDVVTEAMNSSSSQAYNHANTEILLTTPKKSTANTTIKVTKRRRPSKSTMSLNPHITTIHSASELNREIVEPERDCILILTASYCVKCKQMTPQLNRIARRISLESSSPSPSRITFAHADISDGPRGKQVGKVLGVEKVPSVVVFQNGKRVTLEVEEGEASSFVVVERSNLNMLEDVARALESGERVNVNALKQLKMVDK